MDDLLDRLVRLEQLTHPDDIHAAGWFGEISAAALDLSEDLPRIRERMRQDGTDPMARLAVASLDTYLQVALGAWIYEGPPDQLGPVLTRVIGALGRELPTVPPSQQN